MRQIAECDWKLFRRIGEQELDRFCRRTLDEVRGLAETNRSARERYVAIYRLLQTRDRRMARIFDQLRRSTAQEKLAGMIHLGLVTDEELAQFSTETRQIVQVLVGADQAAQQGD